ncbi:hypothetical protein [Thalassobacillus hwangdonensis]|uniref:Calx-beta domain-containing protein n=1 Tax=Thalassobacillus hwangdonensis TaxID=546108 RepID=A0ABW3L6S1_9BACI
MACGNCPDLNPDICVNGIYGITFLNEEIVDGTTRITYEVCSCTAMAQPDISNIQFEICPVGDFPSLDAEATLEANSEIIFEVDRTTVGDTEYIKLDFVADIFEEQECYNVVLVYDGEFEVGEGMIDLLVKAGSGPELPGIVPGLSECETGECPTDCDNTEDFECTIEVPCDDFVLDEETALAAICTDTLVCTDSSCVSFIEVCGEVCEIMVPLRIITGNLSILTSVEFTRCEGDQEQRVALGCDVTIPVEFICPTCPNGEPPLCPEELDVCSLITISDVTATQNDDGTVTISGSVSANCNGVSSNCG